MLKEYKQLPSTVCKPSKLLLPCPSSVDETNSFKNADKIKDFSNAESI